MLNTAKEDLGPVQQLVSQLLCSISSPVRTTKPSTFRWALDILRISQSTNCVVVKTWSIHSLSLAKLCLIYAPSIRENGVKAIQSRHVLNWGIDRPADECNDLQMKYESSVFTCILFCVKSVYHDLLFLIDIKSKMTHRKTQHLCLISTNNSDRSLETGFGSVKKTWCKLTLSSVACKG